MWRLSIATWLSSLLNLPSLSKRARWERAHAQEREVCRSCYIREGERGAVARGASLNNIKQVLEKGVTSRGAPNKWANFHAFSLKRASLSLAVLNYFSPAKQAEKQDFCLSPLYMLYECAARRRRWIIYFKCGCSPLIYGHCWWQCSCLPWGNQRPARPINFVRFQ